MGRPKKVASEPTETEARIDSPKEMKEEKEESERNMATTEGKNGPLPTVRKRGRPRKVVNVVQDQANTDASGEESKSAVNKLYGDDAPGTKKPQKESGSNWKSRRREGSCRRKGEPRRAAD